MHIQLTKPWVPTREGEKIVGRYLGTRTMNGENGPFPVGIIRCSDGQVKCVGGHYAVSLLLNVIVGEKATVTFLGWKPGSDGREAKHFSVEVE